jgi:hypothetical protein
MHNLINHGEPIDGGALVLITLTSNSQLIVTGQK